MGDTHQALKEIQDLPMTVIFAILDRKTGKTQIDFLQ